MYESSGKEQERLGWLLPVSWNEVPAAPEDGVHSLEPSSLCKDAPLNKTESYKHTNTCFWIYPPNEMNQLYLIHQKTKQKQFLYIIVNKGSLESY